MSGGLSGCAEVHVRMLAISPCRPWIPVSILAFNFPTPSGGGAGGHPLYLRSCRLPPSPDLSPRRERGSWRECQGAGAASRRRASAAVKPSSAISTTKGRPLVETSSSFQRENAALLEQAQHVAVEVAAQHAAAAEADVERYPPERLAAVDTDPHAFRQQQAEGNHEYRVRLSLGVGRGEGHGRQRAGLAGLPVAPRKRLFEGAAGFRRPPPPMRERRRRRPARNRRSRKTRLAPAPRAGPGARDAGDRRFSLSRSRR